MKKSNSQLLKRAFQVLGIVSFIAMILSVVFPSFVEPWIFLPIMLGLSFIYDPFAKWFSKSLFFGQGLSSAFWGLDSKTAVLNVKIGGILLIVAGITMVTLTFFNHFFSK